MSSLTKLMLLIVKVSGENLVKQLFSPQFGVGGWVFVVCLWYLLFCCLIIFKEPCQFRRLFSGGANILAWLFLCDVHPTAAMPSTF